jgi:DNA-binding MarR family transcriptional regulator
MSPCRRQSIEDRLRQRAACWPESVTPTAELVVRLFRAANLTLEASAGRMTAHGLGPTEFDVLASLRGAPPPYELLPTELYGCVVISSGGLTKVLHGLQARGLITRKAGDADRRSKPVRLTVKGRARVERAMADVLRFGREMIATGLSDDEAARLTALLRKLLLTLETDAEPAALRIPAE